MQRINLIILLLLSFNFVNCGGGGGGSGGAGSPGTGESSIQTPETPSLLPVGLLYINSEPKGAEVEVRHEFSSFVGLGITPFRKDNKFLAGYYEVKVTKPGYEPFLKYIYIEAQTPSVIYPILTPVKPRLQVELHGVDKANVYIDGHFDGEAPLSISLMSGEHTLEIKKDGYKTFQTSFTLENSESKNIMASLQVAERALSITSTPTEAAVFLNSQFIGTTPLVTSNPLLGSHILTVNRGGFNDFSQNINILENSHLEINATLNQRIVSEAQKFKVLDSGTGTEAFISIDNPMCDEGYTINVFDSAGLVNSAIIKKSEPGTVGFTGWGMPIAISRTVTLRDSSFDLTIPLPFFRLDGLSSGIVYHFSLTGCGINEEQTLTLSSKKDFSDQKIILVIPKSITETFIDWQVRISHLFESINSVFRKSGIQKRFFAETHVYDDLSVSCDDTTLNDPCNEIPKIEHYAEDAITILMIKQDVIGPGSHVDIINRVFFAPVNSDYKNRSDPFPDALSNRFASIVETYAHELGHIFWLGTPEYYMYEASKKMENNFDPMTQPTRDGRTEFYRDRLRNLKFSKMSQMIMNKHLNFEGNIRLEPSEQYHSYSKTISIDVVDTDNAPVHNASISQMCHKKYMEQNNSGYQLVAHVEDQKMTDSAGHATFDSPIPTPLMRECGGSVPFKISKDGFSEQWAIISQIDLFDEKIVNGNDIYTLKVVLPKNDSYELTDTLDCDQNSLKSKVRIFNADGEKFIEWCPIDGATSYIINVNDQYVSENWNTGDELHYSKIPMVGGADWKTLVFLMLKKKL